MPRRRWICPTGSPAISPSSAAPRRSPPTSMSRSVPLSDAARAALARRCRRCSRRVLTGGDDYEIVLTVPPAKLRRFQPRRGAAGVPVTEIGRMRSGDGAQFMRHGKALVFARPAFSHF